MLRSDTREIDENRDTVDLGERMPKRGRHGHDKADGGDHGALPHVSRELRGYEQHELPTGVSTGERLGATTPREHDESHRATDASYRIVRAHSTGVTAVSTAGQSNQFPAVLLSAKYVVLPAE